MDERQRKARDIFVPLAVLEHHLIRHPSLSARDIAERLASVWQETQADAKAANVLLDSKCVMAIQERLAASLDLEPGSFQDESGWLCLLEGCDLEEDPIHTLSWIFSALYWTHLTKFRIATAWLYTNALRVQHHLPVAHLELARLGPFLDSLSGSGPPLYDGQTFYPEDYAGAV